MAGGASVLNAALRVNAALRRRSGRRTPWCPGVTGAVAALACAYPQSRERRASRRCQSVMAESLNWLPAALVSKSTTVIESRPNAVPMSPASGSARRCVRQRVSAVNHVESKRRFIATKTVEKG